MLLPRGPGDDRTVSSSGKPPIISFVLSFFHLSRKASPLTHMGLGRRGRIDDGGSAVFQPKGGWHRRDREGGSSGSSCLWAGRGVLAGIDPGPLGSMSMMYPGDRFSVLSLEST